VALGASLVEKHFIDAKQPPTADSEFSCLPGQLEALRRDMDDAWQARGRVAYGYTEAEEKSLAYRRSLYAIAPIRKGEAFSRDNVRSIRPGFGMSPRHLDDLLGKPAARDFQRGEPITGDALGGAGV
jgi:N-acetylneuraminate synthase